MPKEFSRRWKTSTKLYTLARYIEKNRARFMQADFERCIIGLAFELVYRRKDVLGKRRVETFQNNFGVSEHFADRLFTGSYNLIDPSLKDDGVYSTADQACEALRFLAKEYRKKGE